MSLQIDKNSWHGDLKMRVLRHVPNILVGTCLALISCSCSGFLTTYTVTKAYPGPELRGEYSQVLVLTESDGGSYICSVDGQDTTENGDRLAAYGVLLLPGTHNLEIRYYKSNIYLDGHWYELYSKAPKFLNVNLQAGHSYHICTNVKPHKESKKLYEWEPYLEDITGEPGFILVEAPKRPYRFSLSSPNSNANYIIQTPSPDKWLMHRTADKSDFPVVLKFFRYTSKWMTSFQTIMVILDNEAIDPRPGIIDEPWIRKFLIRTFFGEWAPRELPLDIETQQSIQIGGKEYYEVRCQSIYVDAMDTRKHDHYILYIPRSDIPQEPSPIFAMVKSRAYGKSKEFSPQDIETVLDMITTLRRNIPTSDPNGR